MHSFPDHFLFNFFNARRTGSFLIMSSRVFQRKLHLKGSDSSPKPVVFIVVNCKCFLSSDYTLHTSFHEISTQAMDYDDLLTCKFLSLVSVNFSHECKHYHCG